MRTLVVDDQAVYRHALERVVRAAAGFELVGSVASGAEAIRLAAAQRPDLLLVDYRLQDATGADVAREVLAEDPDAVVILVSAYDASELPADAGTCGAFSLLPKSEVSVATIRDTWDAAVSSRAALPEIDDASARRDG